MYSFKTLPNVAEQKFCNYLSGGFTGTYQKIIPDSTGTISGSYGFHRGFSIDPLTFPAVVVTVDKLKEIEPDTHVYDAELNLSIFTQADDVAGDAVKVHDAAAAQIYALMADPAPVIAAVNASGDFAVYGLYRTNYGQSIGATHNGNRLLLTVVDFAVKCQKVPTF